MKKPEAIAKTWAQFESNPDGRYGLEDVIADEHFEMTKWTEKEISRFLAAHAKEYEKIFRKALKQVIEDDVEA